MEEPFRPSVPLGTLLIETFGFWPDEGARRWALHRARMARSAKHIGYTFDASKADEVVTSIGSEGPLRCRLTLDANGNFDLTSAPLGPTPEGWTMRVSEEKLSSADQWLGVKTTQRALYDSVRGTISAPNHEVIFLNERDEVCEGTISNIFIITQEGKKQTPALACGLLPGILRQYLLENEGYEEAVLSLQDLKSAQQVFIGNSLRGLIPISLTA